MNLLATRLHVLFTEVCTQADLILLYFAKRNYKGMGAGVFDRAFANPRVITMNPSAWNIVKARGSIYQFDPSQDFFMSGHAPPPEEVTDSTDRLLD